MMVWLVVVATGAGLPAYLEAVEVLDAVHELVEERAGLPLRQPLLADDQVEELAALGSR